MAKLAELGIGLTCSPTIGVRGKVRRVLDLWRGEPDLALRLRSEQLGVDLRALLQGGGFDLVQVESLETAPLWLRAVQEVPSPPAILDEFNAEFLLQYRAVKADVESPRRWPVALYSAVQALKLRRYEAQVGRAFERVLAVSRQDARALAPLVGRERLRIVPNTVEVPPFRPTLARTGGANVVFVGTMDYRPNADAVTWFAERVLPLLQSTRGARFTIVGARPTKRVLTLAKQSNVVVTGVVPDVLPYLADADVAVAPIRFGSGSRLKILEALAASVPVVSTTVGAEGLDLRHAEHLLIADEPLAFAQAVSRVLEDDELRCRLAATGHARVAERYDWRALGPKLDAIYAEVTGRGSH
ncbi:MAG: glycosyltransferase [Chloroflexi bacterium]|nr:glycosyltransferase [Chloroflexota bacterium]